MRVPEYVREYLKICFTYPPPYEDNAHVLMVYPVSTLHDPGRGCGAEQRPHADRARGSSVQHRLVANVVFWPTNAATATHGADALGYSVAACPTGSEITGTAGSDLDSTTLPRCCPQQEDRDECSKVSTYALQCI